ncbi:MAG: (2Fe-2S) ferredoxin domain-containing protein [Kiritimatiellae bacterium]|nr:(2Fe-2S) ferredoxin domain-containing protein [Kiritimatiellia bacterium]
MPKLTLADLKALRDQKVTEINQRNLENKTIQVIVGMGTCGIASGAKATFDAFVDELGKKNLTNVTIRQTGCMGLCHSEPTVEVVAPGMPTVIYGKVDGAVARKIVAEHIQAGHLLEDHILDRPAADILKK